MLHPELVLGGPVGNGTDSLPFFQELVSRVLHLHFRNCKTKGLGRQWGGEECGAQGGEEGCLPHNLPFPCSQWGRTAAHGGVPEDLRGR